MIASAYGPLIGGVGTPAGTGVNPIAISYLNELASLEVSFVRWMSVGVPGRVDAPARLVGVAQGVSARDHRLPVGRDEIEQQLDALGPATAVEVKTLLVLPHDRALGQRATSRGAHKRCDQPTIQGIALFLPGINALTWKQAQRDVDWGGVVLIVAGLSSDLRQVRPGGWLS